MRTLSDPFADSRRNAEFFEQFSRERSLWSFSLFDLASWEPPEAGKFLSRSSAGKQNTVALSNDSNEQPQPLADAFEPYRSMHGIGALYCGISLDRLSFSEKEIQSGLLSGNLLEKVLPDAPKCTKMTVFGYEWV